MSTTIEAAQPIASPAQRRTTQQANWLRLLKSRRVRPMILPAAILGIVILATVLASWIAPHDPDALDMSIALSPPDATHILGTDQLGRDMFSRLLYGGRMTLWVSGVSTVGIVTLGLVVGLVAGYFGGRLDLAISTILTVLLALPSLLLSLAILGILGPGDESLLIALVAAGWAGHARIFRASVLSLREQVYIEAAISLGARSTRILGRHLVPNLLPTVIVLATLDFGALLLTVSSLSFLGLGVQPPTADWGVMLNDARPYFSQEPMLMIVPGVCIAAVALTSNLLGDALRDLIDAGHR
ncbi:MAG: ABC transporter permease [Chloroflexi bacterium]|nr:ABC transporter permease [Chloroflexota bacterium]